MGPVNQPSFTKAKSSGIEDALTFVIGRKRHYPWSVFASIVNLNLIRPVDLISSLQETQDKQHKEEAIREI